MIPFLFLANIVVSYNTHLNGNRCQTVGATYRYSFVEQPDGKCGGIDPYTLKIDDKPSNLTCEKIVDDGCYHSFERCSARGYTINGNNTFTKDGSFGIGSETIDMRGRCVSTYVVRIDRLK